MGNCAASRMRRDQGKAADAVALCRERTRLLKRAVECRAALAAAHADYASSLASVAAALGLFVSRLSAPASILLTFGPSTPSRPSDHSFLRHTPYEPKTECFAPQSSSSPRPCPAQTPGGEEKAVDGGCGYIYSTPPPGDGGFEWDFFNPFEGRRAAEAVALEQSSEKELRVGREGEGIPGLEEGKEASRGGEMEKSGDGGIDGEVPNMEEKREDEEEEMGMPEKGRELLEALRDVEDQFLRAFDAGEEVSRMLEVHRVCIPAPPDEAKEGSSKIIQAITWHQSPFSLSSSHKSYLASSSSTTWWTESKGNLFYDHCGMVSGSHSQTLGRLYAWEKKLYEEVKDGDHSRQAYEQKCRQLRNQDAKGTDSHAVDKTRAAVKDLHSRILVALRSAETMSIRIQNLRDEELKPQLIELLHGLRRTWKVMLESHETQKQIMSEVKFFTGPSYGKFCSDSQRHATVKLEAELQHWRTCFMSYVTAQREYVEALDGWLSKFLVPEIECYSRSRFFRPSYRIEAPPMIVICQEWLTSLRKLPDKPVCHAMKSFIKDMRVVWAKQGEELQQKRKVDGLARELDRKVLALQKAENKILGSKISEIKPEPDARQRLEYLAGRKESLDMFRKKLDAEKMKQRDCMQETEQVTFNGFKIGLMNVFESLTDFSKDSLEFYGELLKYNEKVKLNEMAGKPSCI